MKLKQWKMKTKKIIMALTLLIVMSGMAVFAEENINAVILVSTKNYPDRMIAAPAAEKFGIPLILTDGDLLSDETLEAVQVFSPEKIIIVGGPAVVSEEIENELDAMYDVVRLWGVTRYGTAEAVAEYFWPEGSNESMIVEDSMDAEDNDVLAQASEEAKDRGIPLLLSPEDGIPANTLSEMNKLRVKKATSIALGRASGKRFRDQLRNMSIDVDEINATDRARIKRIIRNRVVRRLNKTDAVMVVAAANFTHTVNTPNLPQAKAFIVSGMDQIDDVVSAIEERNIEKVYVVGKPGLAEEIAKELGEKTDAEVILRSGRNIRQRIIANNLSKQFRKRFIDLYREKEIRRIKSLRRLNATLAVNSNITLKKALAVVGVDSPKNARNALRRAEEHCRSRNYSKCVEKAVDAMLIVRLSRYLDKADNLTAVREEIKGEVESLKEKISELIALNRELGEEMRENLSTEERLQVIGEFKHRRKEQVREIVQQARGIREIINSNVSTEKMKSDGRDRREAIQQTTTTSIVTTTVSSRRGRRV